MYVHCIYSCVMKIVVMDIISYSDKYNLVYVIVIAQGQEFMAVNRPESEGVARGFSMHACYDISRCVLGYNFNMT